MYTISSNSIDKKKKKKTALVVKVFVTYAHKGDVKLLRNFWGSLRILIIFDSAPSICFDVSGQLIPVLVSIGNSTVKPAP